MNILEWKSIFGNKTLQQGLKNDKEKKKRRKFNKAHISLTPPVGEMCQGVLITKTTVVNDNIIFVLF